MSTLPNSLRDWAAHEVVTDRRLTIAITIAFFVLATACGAYLHARLPFTVVPITLQPLFVLLAGVLVGPRLGATAMATYLVVGAMGFPVFSGGGAGVLWLMGPTGGYLFAYPIAAFVAGALAGGKDSGYLRLFSALAVGMALIYVGGISQLFILGERDLAGLLMIGVYPFLLGDLVKIFIAMGIGKKLRPSTLERS